MHARWTFFGSLSHPKTHSPRNVDSRKKASSASMASGAPKMSPDEAGVLGPVHAELELHARCPSTTPMAKLMRKSLPQNFVSFCHTSLPVTTQAVCSAGHDPHEAQGQRDEEEVVDAGDGELPSRQEDGVHAHAPPEGLDHGPPRGPLTVRYLRLDTCCAAIGVRRYDVGTTAQAASASQRGSFQVQSRRRFGGGRSSPSPRGPNRAAAPCPGPRRPGWRSRTRDPLARPTSSTPASSFRLQTRFRISPRTTPSSCRSRSFRSWTASARRRTASATRRATRSSSRPGPDRAIGRPARIGHPDERRAPQVPRGDPRPPPRVARLQPGLSRTTPSSCWRTTTSSSTSASRSFS